jgi:hypothetical protein
MEFASPTLTDDLNRQQLAERVNRSRVPKIPASAHRHLLAQRLRALADRVDS